MILEHALLTVRAGDGAAFEAAFATASALIARQKGYLRHELQRSRAVPDRYLLLVWWERAEDHSVGFRGSADYVAWRRLLHHFYTPHPTVEHFERVTPG